MVNKKRCDLVTEKNKVDRASAIIELPAFDELRCQEFSNVLPLDISDICDEMAQCCLQGTNLARHIVQWARSISWVQDMENLQGHQSVGISWFELLCLM